METEIIGRVKGSKQSSYSENQNESSLVNNRGELMVSNAIPLYSSVSSLGNSFEARTTTAAAPVVAVPTTAALIGLWNGEQDNGKSYIIDSVFVIVVAVTAASIQIPTILINMSQVQIPTAIANTITPRVLRANSPYRGCARVAVGITLNATDGIAANWFPMGNNSPLSGATNGTTFNAAADIDCRGLFIVPPKNQFSLTAISTAATASSVQIGMRWHEVILPPVM